jgi:hypothetical protein
VQVTEIDPVAVAAVVTKPAPNWAVKAIAVAPIVQVAVIVIDTGRVPVAVPAWATGPVQSDMTAARPRIAERMTLRRDGAADTETAVEGTWAAAWDLRIVTGSLFRHDPSALATMVATAGTGMLRVKVVNSVVRPVDARSGPPWVPHLRPIPTS